MRLDPKWAIPHVRKAKQNKHYTGANVDMVIEILKKQKCLPVLDISKSALLTCLKVNEEMQSESMPKYQQLKKKYMAQHLPQLMQQLQGREPAADYPGGLRSPNCRGQLSKSMAFNWEQGGYGSEERRGNTKSLSQSPNKRNRANFETFANGNSDNQNFNSQLTT